MANTLEVRKVMNKYLRHTDTIYTNKLVGGMRSVKCYMPDDAAQLLQELRELAGEQNVRITTGSDYIGCPAITVRCTLAPR